MLAALYFSLKTEHFFSHANFVTLLPYFAPFAILAVGEVMLMVAAEIDLSIGSVYLFAPFMFYEFNQAGLPARRCASSRALSVLRRSGSSTASSPRSFGVSSFITTLGMLLGLGGLTLIISHAAPVDMPGAEVTSRVVQVHTRSTGRTSSCRSGSTRSGPSRRSSARAVLPADLGAGHRRVVQVLLTLTRWGMYTIAVGGNKHGAAEAGVKVRIVGDPQLRRLQRPRRLRRHHGGHPQRAR